MFVPTWRFCVASIGICVDLHDGGRRGYAISKGCSSYAILPPISLLKSRHWAGRAYDKIKTVYCHVASTWNLDVVAYIIHTYIYINTHTYIHTF